MAEVSYPTTGGGAVTDTRYEQLIGSVVPSGLIGSPTASSLVYADGSGRQVKVLPSRAAEVRGFRWESDGAGLTRSIAANSSGSPRIDLAVLRLNRNDFTVTFQVVQGTPAAAPVAPTITQGTGSTGVWELPLAEITVANGASTLAGATVRDVSWYIGGSSLTGTANWFPPVTAGGLYTAIDTATVYGAVGSSWHPIGENGSLVRITPVSVWGTSSVYFRRRNGWTFMQALMSRTGADLPIASDSQLFNLPANARPPNSMYVVAYSGGTAMQCYVDSSTGDVTITNKTIIIKTGGSVTVHPVTWPSA